MMYMSDKHKTVGTFKDLATVSEEVKINLLSKRKCCDLSF